MTFDLHRLEERRLTQAQVLVVGTLASALTKGGSMGKSSSPETLCARVSISVFHFRFHFHFLLFHMPISLTTFSLMNFVFQLIALFTTSIINFELVCLS